MHDSTDARIERAKDIALGKHDSRPSHLDEAGEGVGGIGGTIIGAAIGSGGGPIGTIIGGIAGAVGGWWSGRAVTEAVSTLTHEDDEFYREHYESSPYKLGDRSYEDVQPAYHLGHVASLNPDYSNRNWDAVEGDLERGWMDHQNQKAGEGWTPGQLRKAGDWNAARNYASEGFRHGRQKQNANAEGQLDDK
ncbi:MAG: hypothetical protein ABJE47_04540 [bacterium]